MHRSKLIRQMLRVALALALAVALSLVAIRFPNGGKVSLDMVPVLVLALCDGAPAGFLCGLLFGGIDFMLEPVYIHPVQIVLDYAAGFGSLGLAGCFAGWYRRTDYRPLIAQGAVLVAGLSRYACSVVSGVIWFTHGHWALSAGINAGYLLPDILLALILVPQVAPQIARHA